MDRQIINFSANEQSLIKTGGVDHYAGNIVRYIEAHFDLGANWTGYDSVRAIWRNKRDVTGYSTVLNSEGVCIVPFEVLTMRGDVCMNLVGSIVENDVLVDRLTTYPICALTIDVPAMVDGSDPASITPSEYEQFVASVRNDADRAETGATASEASASEASASAEQATASAQASGASALRSASSAQNAQNSERNASEYAQDAHISAQNAETFALDAEEAKRKILSMRAEATTLAEGSQATASYSDGLLTLGIPKGDTGATGAKGETGETGATPNLTIGTVETLEPNESATATITGTAENPVLNLGLPQGRTGEVTYEDLDSLLPRDTATGNPVTITDGQSVIPVKSLEVELEPIQDLHGYDKPWVGGAGKNKIPPKTGQAGSAQLILGDDATAIASASGVYLKSGTYTLSVNSTKTNSIYWYDVSSGTNEGIGNTLAPRTVTVSADGYYFPFLYNSSGISSSDVSTFQLEEGSSATSYEPYSNICPISGHTEVVTQRTGVNVWDEEWENGTFNTTTGANINTGSAANQVRSKNLMPVIAGATYHFTVPSGIWCIFYDKSGNVVTPPSYDGNVIAHDGKSLFLGDVYRPASVNYTIFDGVAYMKFYCQNVYGTTYNNDISINYPSTDTDYHAYQGETYTTTLGRTVYGGDVEQVSGVMTDKMAIIDLGDLDWAIQTSWGGVTSFVPTNASTLGVKTVPSSEVANWVCSCYEITSANKMYLGKNKAVCQNAYIRISDSAFTDAVSFKQSVTGQKLVYELATPQTYQLDPQTISLLHGNNNVWSDGDITMVYSADVAKWIEKRLNQ